MKTEQSLLCWFHVSTRKLPLSHHRSLFIGCLLQAYECPKPTKVGKKKKSDACNVTRWFLGTPPSIAPALEDYFRSSLRWVQRWQAPNDSKKLSGEGHSWWSRICLAMQRMRVPPLVRELGSHTLRSNSACVPQLESQLSLGATSRESMHCNKGSRVSN